MRTTSAETDWSPGPAWLFCPADRPDRYRKALARADIVVLDLEDAVAPDRKDQARHAVATLIADGVYDHQRTVLRANGAAAPGHDGDAHLIAQSGIGMVMLAKTERVADLEALPGTRIVALLETPLGVENAGEIARADPVVALMWGADDLVAGLGGTASRRPDGSYRDVARFARSRSLVAAKAHGKAALDAVFMDLADEDGLRAECEDAVAVGFDAKVAVHPKQIPVIRTAFTPPPEQIAWARRLLAQAGHDRGVMAFEGRMVDGPIYAQAERILRIAQSTAAAGFAGSAQAGDD